MFKVTRIVWNGKDQPTANLYHIIKPTAGHPYYQLLYHKPNRTIYLSGNVKIVWTEQKQASIACRPLSEPTDNNSSNEEEDNPYNYLREKGALKNEQT